MLPYYKHNESFMKLWNEIPEVINYDMYINLLNHIDTIASDRYHRYLSESEEKTLIQALETYMEIREIKKEEA